MGSVSVNPPKTPVTKGSNGVAAATIPNVCKMPGPPAPFVPAPLPNIGKSMLSPKDYSTSVTIEGNAVAIRGSTFESIGDIASKGTGGGLISANTHGITKFIGPGSMDVQIEGKNVQLLSDPMLNNCAAGGSPPNAATMLGVIQMTGLVAFVEAAQCPICGKGHGELAESEQTKIDAGSLADKFKAEVDPILALPKAGAITTMLGVVHCRCGAKKPYADQSAMTTKELCQAANAAGMTPPKNVTVSYRDGKDAIDAAWTATLNAVKEGISKHLGNSPVFQAAWQEASERSDYSFKNRPRAPAAYPPGNCAAQKTLLAVIDDKGLPKAMTEQLFKGTPPAKAGKPPTPGAPVKYIDLRTGTRDVQQREFTHGETVPPCGSCEVIVPLLICDEDKKTCPH